MKILLLDIETSPNTAYVWRLFKENIGINQIVESSYVLCWAAKWLGSNEVFFSSVHTASRDQMLKAIHTLLDEADGVVHFNGTSFDIPTLNKEFLLAGLGPPAPYKQVDLLKVAKEKFRFTSNKLHYIAKALGFGGKKETTFELWVDCMNNKPEAWEKMEEYNKQDVILLEKLYREFLPWINDHPNRAIYSNDPAAKAGCPNCSSTWVQKRGFHYTTVSAFQRYQCMNCGNWFRNGVNKVKDQKWTMRNVPR